MCVWGRKPLPMYGGRMSESVLAILYHILKGGKLIQEKLESEKESEVTKPVAAASSDPGLGPAATGTPTEPPASSTPADLDVNFEPPDPDGHGLPQLARERCVDAMQVGNCC